MVTQHDSYQDAYQDTFRLERSIITKQNTDQIAAISGDHIAEALIYYICYEHQYNIFGFGRIDPEDFAKRFNFSTRYLREKHEKPYQKIILKMDETQKGTRRLRNANRSEPETYTSRIENALFILANLPLMVGQVIVDDEKKTVRELRPVRLLQTLFIEQNKTTGKVSFAFQLEEGFQRNLSTFYQRANTKSLVRLRKSRYNVLYLHLLRMRDATFAKGLTSTTVEDTSSFAYLCQLANVNEKQEPKYMKRDLNAAFRKINEETELEFAVEWTRGANDQGQKYTPIFHFEPQLGEVIGENSWGYGSQLRREEKLDVACLEFKHNLFNACPYHEYRYMDNAEKLFYEWIKTDTPEQRKSLEYILTKTFMNINCPIPGDISQRVDQFIRDANEKPSGRFNEYVQEVFYSRRFKF